MKECIFCQVVVEDEAIRCHKCGCSCFVGSTRWDILSEPAEKRIEHAIRASGIDVSLRQLEKLKEVILFYCQKRKIAIDQVFIEKLTHDLASGRREDYS